MVWNKLCWDAIYAVGLKNQRKLGLDWYAFLCFGSLTALFVSQRSLFCTMWPDCAKGLLPTKYCLEQYCCKYFNTICIFLSFPPCLVCVLVYVANRHFTGFIVWHVHFLKVTSGFTCRNWCSWTCM